jgi:hypothetical protein
VVRAGADGTVEGTVAAPVAGAGSTALTIGTPDPALAFLSTTLAPNDATETAITVPATQAARPATTRMRSSSWTSVSRTWMAARPSR